MCSNLARSVRRPPVPALTTLWRATLRSTAVPLSVLAAVMLVGPVTGMSLAESSSSILPPARQAVPALVSAGPGVLVATMTAPTVSPGRVASSAPAAPSLTASQTAPRRARTYTIQDGDSLWSISQRHGVAMEALAAENRLALTAPLRLGTVLTIPSAAAATAPSLPAQTKPAQTKPARVTRPARTRTAGGTVTHVVQSGETLWDIAKEYETSVEALADINDLDDSDRIKPGQRLAVSGGSVPRYRQIPRVASRPARPVEPEPDESMLKRGEGLSWPSRGTLTSRFGWRYRRHHDGIDVAAPWGTPIQAARDGTVVFVGWHGGYGKVVFVSHGDGVVTVYGHASKLLVKIGDQVKQGQVIANVGCTGVCTGSHLHFEVRIDGQAVDPLKFL